MESETAQNEEKAVKVESKTEEAKPSAPTDPPTATTTSSNPSPSEIASTAAPSITKKSDEKIPADATKPTDVAAATDVVVPVATGGSTAVAPTPIAATVPIAATTLTVPPPPVSSPMMTISSIPPSAPKPPEESRKRKLPGQMLSDYPLIQQTVRDILTLLHQYGPLSDGQLIFNLPNGPVADILKVLACIGLIRRTKEGTYASLDRPRPELAWPPKLVEELEQAKQEYDASQKRIQALEEALEQPEGVRSVLQGFWTEYGEDLANDPVYWAALRNVPIEMRSKSEARKPKS